MAEPTTCTRHPSTETRLRCSSCDTPICPRCAVEAPVGMRCPDCGRAPRAGGLRRRPDQIGRAAGVAVIGALLGGAVIGGVRILLPFGGLVAAYVVGLQIGMRIRRAASGNTVDVVRYLAIGGALGSAVVAELVRALAGSGSVAVSIYSLLGAGIAAYAAWSALR